MNLTKKQIAVIRRAFPDDWEEERAAESPEDAAEECLMYASPEVDTAHAWGPGESYLVSIRGVSGAYFVQASEFDKIGVFSTLKEAKDARESAWAGVELFGSEEDARKDAEDKGYV